MSQSLEQALATHVAQCRLEQISSDAITAAKRSIVDAIAVMIAGSAASGVPTLVDIGQRGVHGDARIVPSGARTKAAQAAWINAIQMRALELDDCTDFSPSHPSAAILPALLAVADVHTVSGADFLRGLALAQDLSVRFYRAIKSSLASGRNDMHRIFSATAAIAAALNLDADTTHTAMAIASAAASGDMQSSFEGTMSSWVQTGHSARAAIESCTLAKAGVTGPKQFLTGRAGYFSAFEPDHDLDGLMRAMGATFQGALITIKPYAACRAQHAILDMARALHNQPGGIDLDQIATISITVSPPVYNLVGVPAPQKRHPTSVHDAQFSAYFAAAVGLVRGDMGLRDSEAPTRSDTALQALSAKVEVAASEQNLTDEIIGRADMIVVMSDGREFSQSSSAPRGSPRNPMSPSALRAKLDDCIAFAGEDMDALITSTARQNFMDEVDNLERAPSAHTLLDALLQDTSPRQRIA